MILYFTLIFGFTIILIDSKLFKKRHVPNCVEPQQPEEVYNLEGWIGYLHLQQCVFVAIGENFYAIFLEKRPRQYDSDQDVRDFFLGICDYKTLKKWSLCPLPIESKRKEDCNFDEDGQSSPRVHRRLCETSDIAQFGDQCDCDMVLRGERLIKVIGFPTCFRSNMAETLCGYHNICGLFPCKLELVSNRVFTSHCDPSCLGHLSFCANPNWDTAKPREINSFWTDWSETKCADNQCISQYNEADCINKDTGIGDVDCLGPGSSCCAGDLIDCKCHVFVEEGMAKVIRTYSVPRDTDYDDLSLDEIIKNLPVKSDRHPGISRDKPQKSKPQKISRRHTMHGEAYDDTYDHAYNVKIVKDNIHAKVQDREEQIEEHAWLRQRPLTLNRTLSMGVKNNVEPRDVLATFCRPNPAKSLMIPPASSCQREIHQVSDQLVRVSSNPASQQFRIEPYSKNSYFRSRERDRDDDDDVQEVAADDGAADDDDEIRRLEKEEEGADADDDVLIEEEDVLTTTTTLGYDPEDVRGAQVHNLLHQNDSGGVAIDTHEGNVTHREEDSGAARLGGVVVVVLVIHFGLINCFR